MFLTEVLLMNSLKPLLLTRINVIIGVFHVEKAFICLLL